MADTSTPESIRDRLGTPDFVFHWANTHLYEFDIDLAAEAFTAKCAAYFSKDDDSLSQSWSGLYPVEGTGWCNPPYSKPITWVEKAWLEAQQGFTSVFYMAMPSGENAYRDFIFGKASKIIFINGRINHIAPEDYIKINKKTGKSTLVKQGDEIKGNRFGNCFIVFDRDHEGETKLDWVDRADMQAEYEQFLAANK